MKNLFFDGLGLRFEIPQNPTDELSMIWAIADFVCGALTFVPKGMTGYPLYAKIETSDSTFICRYGSMSHNMTLHVEAKGAGAELLRSFVLFHPALVWHCTRADIAYDFTVKTDLINLDMSYPKGSPVVPRSHDDGFWFVHERLNKMALQKSITTSTDGAWHMPEGGRTFYIGAKGAKVQSLYRLYEKTEERRKAGILDFPEGVIRFEWQYRPRNKIAITELDPYAIIATNRTAIHFFELLTDSSIEYIRTESTAKAGDDVVFIMMLRQYRNVLRRTQASKGARWMLERTREVLEGEA